MTGDLFKMVRTDQGDRFVAQAEFAIQNARLARRITDSRRPLEIRPHFADRADVPRLTGQNGRILARLKQGPATNRELLAIALNYRARISDVRDWLRRRGWTIAKRNLGGGSWEYRLERVTDDASRGAGDRGSAEEPRAMPEDRLPGQGTGD